ncbi:MAG: VCBS repeat-containing protein [Chlorobiota bacterium]|nr:VCBS repeat-containing protein [Chlorobiota bacterium]QQS67498.1 MAG: VCBS repeat-containing protein [Chlorobiota bacterium]
MKTSFYFLLSFFLFVNYAYSQDTTWFKDVTAASKLNSVKSGQISSVDLNGDDYPDLILTNLAYDRTMKTRIYYNFDNPDSSNPKARIFVDVTDSISVYVNRDPAVKGRVADVWATADFNNDGYNDIITGIFFYDVKTFKDVGDRAEILLNDGTGRYNLVQNSGLNDLNTFVGGLYDGYNKYPCTGYCFLDYDLDGNIDIYVTVFSVDHGANLWVPGFLLKGNGDGTFKDVSESAGLYNVQEPCYGASITDWNNDGFQDIVTSPYCRTDGTLWKNNGNGTFDNFTEGSGYTATNGMHGNIDGGGSAPNYLWFPREVCQWEALPCDFDNDGDMDIAQMLVHGGLDPQEAHSPLTLNSGIDSSYKLHWDLNKFDRPLITGTIIKKDTLKKDTSWSNQYGNFSLKKGSIIFLSNYGHLGDQAGSWFDMDGDMLQDFVLSTTGYDATNDRCYIEHQNKDHSFTEIANKLKLRTILKETHSNRPLDFDLDGDDDWLIEYAPRTANANSGRVWLFENRIAELNNHTSIKLIAPKGCNKNCIGARIYVTSGGTTQMRDIQSGVGRWGMTSPFILNFGLEKNTIIDSIVVRWPKKGLPKTTIKNPAINKMLLITESGLSNVDNKIDKTRNLSFFPNPAVNSITAELPFSFLNNSSLLVFNSFGKKVCELEVKNSNQRIRLPIENFISGKYFVKISDSEGKSLESSFIIEK